MVEILIGAEEQTRVTRDVEFVEVAYGRSRDEAEHFRSILDKRSIPAEIERAMNLPAQCGVAVLVESDRLLDASEALTRMAHDDDQDDFEIEDEEEETDDDEYEDDDELELDDDDADDDEEDFEEEDE